MKHILPFIRKKTQHPTHKNTPMAFANEPSTSGASAPPWPIMGLKNEPEQSIKTEYKYKLEEGFPQGYDDFDNEGEEDDSTSANLPKFWTELPVEWFLYIEGIFHDKGIKSQRGKFRNVIETLSKDEILRLNNFRSFINHPNAYDLLKQNMLNVFHEDESSRMARFFDGSPLGDRRPSDMLSEMRSLLGINSDNIDPSLELLMKETFLKRIPAQVRRIIVASDVPQTLDSLARKADSILSRERLNLDSDRSDVNITANRTNLDLAQPYVNEHLQRQVQNLTDEISFMKRMQFNVGQQSNNRGNYQGGFRNKGFRRSNFSNNQVGVSDRRGMESQRYDTRKGTGYGNQRHTVNSDRGFNRFSASSPNNSRNRCFYHRSFGNKALRCVQPCDFERSNASKNLRRGLPN
ncbi:uncharacterized protein LOC144750117 [Ciona intestinalis]